MTRPSLIVNALSLSYNTQKGSVRALNNISLQINKGETLAIVGESGSGKTTLAKAVAGLLPSPRGSIVLSHDKDFFVPASRQYKKKIQLIFQNPDSVFNPKRTMEWHYNEVFSLWHPTLSREKKEARITCLLEMLELESDILPRYTFELSGGQKQRASLLRSLLVEPDFLLLDEPLASQDAPKRKNLLDLLRKLQRLHSLGYLYITHDLSSLHVFSDKVAVMYQGELVEWSERKPLLAHPVHPYTKKLLQAQLFHMNDELKIRGKI